MPWILQQYLFYSLLTIRFLFPIQLCFLDGQLWFDYEQISAVKCFGMEYKHIVDGSGCFPSDRRHKGFNLFCHYHSCCHSLSKRVRETLTIGIRQASRIGRLYQPPQPKLLKQTGLWPFNPIADRTRRKNLDRSYNLYCKCSHIYSLQASDP